jgi:outer membrane protein assembly factor BamB
MTWLLAYAIAGECPDAVAAMSIPRVPECVAAPVVGTFTPILEWVNEAPGDTYTTPVVGDLTGDGRSEVVVVNAAGEVFALNGTDGQLLWRGGQLGREPMTAAIGDIDGDGSLEVVAAGDGGVTAFEGSTGTVLWSNGRTPSGVLAACGAVGLYDLDLDGDEEVVLGALILDGRTGAVLGEGGSGVGSASTQRY